MKLTTVIQRHYGLKRRVTEAEVRAEIESLQRHGLAYLDDSQLRLAFAIEDNSDIEFRSDLSAWRSDSRESLKEIS